VTDFLGLRIITHYVDEVDAVAGMIEAEFAIDVENSVDRRDTMDPDRFGYLSLHYVATLSKARSNLTEYKRFENAQFEIQIRSILQHAWAEIEHDLGYKAQFEVPRSVRRRFSRLAGLLEVGDEEFVHIRDDLGNYAEQLKSLVVRSPDSVPIDQLSIRVFIERARVVREADRQIAGGAADPPAKLVPIGPRGSGGHARTLSFEQLETIGDVRRALEEHRDAVERLANVAFGADPHPSLPRGISLLYLGYFLAARRGGGRGLAEMIMQTRDVTGDAAKRFSKEIMAALDQAGVSFDT
jgi:putative GTP pyrophosphokinase